MTGRHLFRNPSRSLAVWIQARLIRFMRTRAGKTTLEPGIDRADRGRELIEALELAAQFPARHAEHLEYPKFPEAR